MRGFLKACWILAFAVAALVYPAAMIIGATATEVLMVTPHAPEIVELNKGDRLDRSDPAFERIVAQIYGIPTQEKIRVVFVPAERFVRPSELPSLTLLPVDKAKGENPLQVQTVDFFAKWTNLGAAGAGIVFLIAWLLKRRSTSASPAPLPQPPTEKAGPSP